MTRMPTGPDAPPLLTDANARYRARRWTPLRVFAWTFLFASLALWISAIPAVRGFAGWVAEGWRESPLRERLDERLHRDPDADWRPRLD